MANHNATGTFGYASLWRLTERVGMNQKGTHLLTLGREVRMPADIVYGSLEETPNESYDSYVETV